MRTLSESIIGRKGGTYNSPKNPGDLYPGQDLEYGEIVVPIGLNTYYICLPTEQCIGWWSKHNEPRYQTVLVRYCSINYSSACYTCDLTRKYRFVRYIREYKNIKTPEDLRRVFDKYNIPYE